MPFLTFHDPGDLLLFYLRLGRLVDLDPLVVDVVLGLANSRLVKVLLNVCNVKLTVASTGLRLGSSLHISGIEKRPVSKFIWIL